MRIVIQSDRIAPWQLWCCAPAHDGPHSRIGYPKGITREGSRQPRRAKRIQRLYMKTPEARGPHIPWTLVLPESAGAVWWAQTPSQHTRSLTAYDRPWHAGGPLTPRRARMTLQWRCGHRRRAPHPRARMTQPTALGQGYSVHSLLSSRPPAPRLRQHVPVGDPTRPIDTAYTFKVQENHRHDRVQHEHRDRHPRQRELP